MCRCSSSRLVPGPSVGTTTGNPLRACSETARRCAASTPVSSILFVPIYDATEMRGILATGPFARARPTERRDSASLVRSVRCAGTADRSSVLALRDGHDKHPDVGGIDVCDVRAARRPLRGSDERSRQRRCDPHGGRGAAQAAVPRPCPAAHAADLARSLVDERSGQWPEQSQPMLLEHGLRSSAPLCARGPAPPAATPMPIRCDDMSSSNALQRASTALDHASSVAWVADVSAISGPLFVLIDEPGNGQRTRVKLADLGHHASTLASRFGFRLHMGGGHADQPGLLPQSYRAALWAAEKSSCRRSEER